MSLKTWHCIPGHSKFSWTFLHYRQGYMHAYLSVKAASAMRCSRYCRSKATKLLRGRNSESVFVYPNPFSTQAVVRITNDYEFANKNLELKVYNLLGQQVHHQALSTKHEILSTNLPDGIYFYEVTSDKQPIASPPGWTDSVFQRRGKLVKE